jgi:hypothetical protein
MRLNTSFVALFSLTLLAGACASETESEPVESSGFDDVDFVEAGQPGKSDGVADLGALTWNNIVNLSNPQNAYLLDATAIRPFRGKYLRLRIDPACGNSTAGDVQAFGFNTGGFPIQLALSRLGVSDNPKTVYWEVNNGDGATVRTIRLVNLRVTNPFGCTFHFEQANDGGGGGGGGGGF